MRDANGFQVKKTIRITHRKTCKKNLSVLILILILVLILVLVLTLTLTLIKLPNLTETLAVTLAGILRFELCLLSGRNKVRVSFQVFDNFFRDNFSFETPKRTFD